MFTVTQLVSHPPLFFSLYLVLVHTFLIATHAVPSVERSEVADCYCNLMAALIMSYKFGALKPQEPPAIDLEPPHIDDYVYE